MKVLLIAYDAGNYINYFPMGLAYVAGYLERQGYGVEICPMDKYHFTDDELWNYIIRSDPDIVGTGMCAGYWQYNQLKRIADVVHLLSQRPQFWVGGHLVSPAGNYFKELTKADYICPGEYDYTQDLDSIPFPPWQKFDIDYYSLLRLPHADYTDRCFPVLSGRGCPFHCNFCYRMSKGYRARSIPNIMEEVDILIKDYRINYIDFADELLMVDYERPIQIAEELKKRHIKWMCNGRLNFARPDVLKKMKDAGCVFINYGIESVDDAVLHNMHKNLTHAQIIKGVEATLEAGISPGLNIIWGNIKDTPKTLFQSVDFLLKYDDHTQLRTIRPVTPYPGSELFDYAVERGMIKDVADFYENLHKNSDLASVQFTGLSNQDFHRYLKQANSQLINRHLGVKREELQTTLNNLYDKENTTFRGFRQI